MKAKHTPGPWKVVPCPIHGGKHPLQDARWIMTGDADIEMSPYVQNDWRLSSGSLICQMRDTLHQPHDARLIAAAPELLEACKRAMLWVRPLSCPDALFIRDAIKKATGEDNW